MHVHCFLHTGPRAGAFLLALIVGLPLRGWAVVPRAERLLPHDTVLMVTAPDSGQMRAAFRQSATGRLWCDPAMKPFADHARTKFQDELVTPLERELGINLVELSKLARGQVTFALTQDGWPEKKADATPGWVLLVDAQDQASQVQSNLAQLKACWVDAGKILRTESIRDREFMVLVIRSNDVPATLKKLFTPAPPRFADGTSAPAAEEPAAPTVPREVFVGQVDSLMLVGNSGRVLEGVLSRWAGGQSPPLAEVPLFQADHLALFRSSPPLLGWVNLQTVFRQITLAEERETRGETDSSESVLAPPRLSKIVSALGLAGVHSLAFAVRETAEGSFMDIRLTAPESERKGLVKILAGEPREATPPPFVPADAVKFQRWRVHGPRAWQNLETMLAEIFPQASGVINFILETAGAATRERDPSFNLKQSLVEGLGDDFLTYEKPVRNGSSAGDQTGPTLTLVGSPKPEPWALAFKTLLAALNPPSSGQPTEREFLGRKIYTLPLPPLPLAEPGRPQPRVVHFAAAGGYVALSTDGALVEEFLRNAENPGKPLRELPGLLDALARVTGPGVSLIGYENQAETTRQFFETLKASANSQTNLTAASLLPGLGLLPGDGSLPVAQWFDPTRLPAFDRVSGYFHRAVYSVSASPDALTVRVFAPMPPALKQAEAP